MDVSLNYFLIISCGVFLGICVLCRFADICEPQNRDIWGGGQKGGGKALVLFRQAGTFGAFQKEIGGRQKMEGTGDFLS